MALWIKLKFLGRMLYIFCLGTFFMLSGCYYMDTAKGQLSINWNKEPLAKALKDPDLAEYTSILVLVPQIKNFGTQVVGLKNTPNFVEVYKAPGPGVTHVLTAAPKLALKPYEWKYIWVGSLPFRGYFNEKDFQKMRAELVEQGLDVWSFYSSAYSTLGWFKDPITTPMLSQGLPALAENILHEMVHETIYIKNQGDLNESMASFIGHEAAREFVLGQLGGDILWQKQEEKAQNYTIIEGWLKDSYNAAEKIYHSTASDTIKLQERENLFANKSLELKKLLPGLPKDTYILNNARLLQWKRYNQKDSFFTEIWASSGQNWRTFFQLLPEKLQSNKGLTLAQP